MKRAAEESGATAPKRARAEVGHGVPGLALRPTTVLRGYQQEAIDAVFSGDDRASVANDEGGTIETPRSGIVILPCGAGKTLTAIAAACRAGGSCMVLCTSTVAVAQWRREFLRWTRISERNVVDVAAGAGVCRRAAKALARAAEAREGVVVLSTYSMMTLSDTRRSAATRGAISALSPHAPWGLLVLDEVHVVPAVVFRAVCEKATCRARGTLGLTATLVREDGLVDDLYSLVGPRLYEASWASLEAAGHIARVACTEVRCAVAPEYDAAAKALESKGGDNANSAARTNLLGLGPAKVCAVRALVAHHEARGDKILVFCESLYVLLAYARLLDRPALYGETPLDEREFLLARFRESPPAPASASTPTSSINCLLLSSVGDCSIDLPNASVIVQVSGLFGSRRQESQRIGRITRPKPDGAPAHFYTLVAEGTREVAYAEKRREFVAAQGYTFRTIDAATDATIAACAVAPAPHEAARILAACIEVGEQSAAAKAPPKDTPAVRRQGLYTRAPARHPLFAKRKKSKM